MSNKETAMLKIADIKKKYIVADQEIWALKGIDLQFRANEFVSILGPSGCGKTTMLNLIGGLDKYSEGDLVINGTSTKNFSDSDWDAYRNNSIGFVFQSYNLIPHLTILGNVELALTLSGVSKTERTQRASEVLGKVGLQDHITKKPNQLSGGQMQRVAIARALINNPDIILADEPTGALDSETSVQIMDLLKEVAKEKLVIMVTHNPELADEYSSRIVKFKDGLLIEDSNPFKEQTEEKSTFKPKKTAMPFKMALSLSLKNLLSKKTRTMITAIAGSIGIIGISCVLALSTGFQSYVDDMQEQLTGEYPFELTQYTIDMESAMNDMLDYTNQDKYIDDEYIFNSDFTAGNMTWYINNFNDEFLAHLEEIDENLYNEILITYALNLNVFVQTGNSYTKVETKSETNENVMMEMMMPSSNPWGQLLTNTDFMLGQYDVLAGKVPTEKNEVVLFVDQYNQIDTETLENLGLTGSKIAFDDIIGHQFKLFTNDKMYDYAGMTLLGTPYYSELTATTMTSTKFATGMDIEIVGIMRGKESATVNSLSCTIGYTKDLTEYLIDYETNEKTVSDIVKYFTIDENSENPSESLKMFINPLTGEYYEGIVTETLYGIEMPVFTYNDDNEVTGVELEEGYSMMTVPFLSMTDFGGQATPTDIDIYAKTLDAKEKIKEHIQIYNDSVENEEDKIIYVDAIEMMVGSLNTVIAAISYILIAFTSISLIVSSVMIGIITYVSVIERTKEIGVLRSIGARKKDISRVFNAETIIIGFTAGMFAIIFTYLISIPTNIIVSAAVDIDNIANLNPIAAAILVLISIMLTLIAGLIPSSIAAKKDPVTALRSE